MSEADRMREVLTEPLTPQLLERRTQEGWRAAAIEWERIPEAGTAEGTPLREVPYGLRVAQDHEHLEDSPDEVRVLLTILEGIVEDQPMSRISAELNRHGWRTRSGAAWTQSAVFELLPRLIDSSPELFRRRNWQARSTTGAGPVRSSSGLP